MRVVVHGECIYCYAIKNSFCKVLPTEEDQKKCSTLVDQVGENDEFVKFVDSLSKDVRDRAFKALQEFLQRMVENAGESEETAKAQAS